MDIHVSYWLAENLNYGATTLLQRTSKLAMLPIAATGSGGPSPRPPPSERQDTWGVMASYNRYIQAWVGGVSTWIQKLVRLLSRCRRKKRWGQKRMRNENG